jgi:hypothetical protein
MKLYQKFLYSILLVSIFCWYANLRHTEIEKYKLRISAIESSYKLEIDNLKSNLKVTEHELSKSKKDFADWQVQNESSTENLICDYITTNYKRTPITVAKEIAKTIVEVSKEKQVAAPLLLGITEVESNFNPYAVSKAGARGLMQVMPEWVGKLPTELDDKFSLHDIRTGIESGVDVFKIHLTENEGDVNKALYYYVNKDDDYVLKVYTAVGKYLAFKKGE